VVIVIFTVDMPWEKAIRLRTVRKRKEEKREKKKKRRIICPIYLFYFLLFVRCCFFHFERCLPVKIGKQHSLSSRKNLVTVTKKKKKK
jgi:hypothetical protein